MAWWNDLLQVGASIAGPALAASIANQGADNAADAQISANREATNLQRDIYQDRTARSEPWRQSGFNALNFQNQWLGLPQVSQTPAGGGFGFSGSSNALSPNLGAGQPVAGHSGGGPNPLASSLGSAIGGAAGSFLGPLGSIAGNALGGAVGGMFRQSGPKGDNWTTLATQAPGGFDYASYMQSNPDLQAEWSKPDVQSLFGGNPDAYANWHYNRFGKGEGRTLNPLNTQSNQPVGGTQLAGQSGAAQPDLWSTIKANPLYTAATQGFLGIDKPQVAGAFSQAGQALSGAAQKALFDRGTARSYNALGDIFNQYGAMSGTGQTTAGQQNQYAGQFGTNAGNIMMNSGQIAGQAAQNKNANWATAAGNALGGVYDYGKTKGWFGA